MSDVLNQAGRFEPIHEAHAIEHVVFVLQFEPPLVDTFFSKARNAAEQFMPALPGRVEFQGVTLAFGPAGAIPPTPPAEMVLPGVIFRRIAPDGIVENELRVERTSITFITTLYTRWDKVWSQASEYFNALVPIYAAQARITGINLNFVDKFKWVGDLTKCSPNLLLRAKSKYLCPHVFEVEDLWHSHTGAFIWFDKNTKRLININVDYLDENRTDGMSRVVSITTVMSHQFNQPEYEACDVEEKDIIQFVNTHMQALHVLGKDIIGNIINDEMSKRIALIEP